MAKAKTGQKSMHAQIANARIYLDSCAIQPPLDTCEQVRPVFEAEAVVGILALCESGQAELISSDALLYGAEQNPSSLRRKHARAILANAKHIVGITPENNARAEQLVAPGFQSLDALPLTPEVSTKADFFAGMMIVCNERQSV